MNVGDSIISSTGNTFELHTSNSQSLSVIPESFTSKLYLKIIYY